MCSVTEAEEELTRLEIKSVLKDCGKCMKCDEKPAILVRARDPLCRSCFLNYFTHKFRATLGKAKVVRQGEKVLVAFSGGPASCCLLHLIKEGLSENTHKKLRFIPDVVFIDEGEILGWSADKSHNVDSSVHKFVQDLGFNVKVLKISSVLTSEDEIEPAKDKSCSCTSDGPDVKNKNPGLSSKEISSNKIKELFQNLKSLTAKQDLLNNLRLRLLIRHAKENNFSKILVAETSTTLSIKLLSNIALGRGGSLPVEIGVFDQRDKDVGIVRPMRELTSKEVAFYNRIQNIEPICVHALDTMESNNASLQKQTEAFVSNLQASFPSTVSTIFRTGDKLTLVDESTNENCALCKVPMAFDETDYDNNDDSEIETSCSSNNGCCGSGDGSCSSLEKDKIELSREDVIRALCYGCQLTFRDMKYNISLLPPFAVAEIGKMKRRLLMKKSIQEFLL